MKDTESSYRRITFRVTTDEPLDVGEQVFVAGNLDSLGAWAPDGLPLSRVDDAVWAGWVDVPASARVEFKITRGRWESEALGPDLDLARNLVVQPGTRDLTVSHFVKAWRDRTA